MKNNFVIANAMALVLGVTASAYAANPFSDVPKGHWAYQAVDQLAAAGIVEGYGTGFGGDKLATRYEMAQVVARAMAKGANCEKLAAEFADELAALGVRTAALEKKVDNVKITGQIRYSYAGYSGDEAQQGSTQYNRFRTRLFVNGAINDAWTYTGMLENDRVLNQEGGRDGNNVYLKRAFVDGRLGGIKVKGGRIYFCQSDMLDANADGVEASFSDGKVGLRGLSLRNVDNSKWMYKTNDDGDRIYMVNANAKLGNLGVFVEYWKANAEQNTVQGGKIWELGLSHPIGKDLTLAAQYYRSDVNEDMGTSYSKNGWEAGVRFAGAKASKAGSWGAWANYMDRPVGTFIRPTAVGTYAYNSANWVAKEEGYKGYELGANYAFAKNIVGTVRYYDLNGRSGDRTKVRTYWGDVTFSF